MTQVVLLLFSFLTALGPSCPWVPAYMPDERCGVGIFERSERHVFQFCCVMHDRLYESNHMGFGPESRDFADEALLQCMLRKAKKSPRLRARAYLFYELTRACGGQVWGRRVNFPARDMPPFLGPL